MPSLSSQELTFFQLFHVVRLSHRCQHIEMLSEASWIYTHSFRRSFLTQPERLNRECRDISLKEGFANVLLLFRKPGPCIRFGQCLFYVTEEEVVLDGFTGVLVLWWG